MIDAMLDRPSSTALIGHPKQDWHEELDVKTTVTLSSSLALMKAALPTTTKSNNDSSSSSSSSMKSVSKILEDALSIVDEFGPPKDDGTDDTETTLSEDDDSSSFSSTCSAPIAASSAPAATAVAPQQDQQPQQQQQSRRVHFDLDANVFVETDLVGGLTEEDVDAAWYNEEEWEDMYCTYEYEMVDGQMDSSWLYDLHCVAAMCHQVAIPGRRAWKKAVLKLAQPDTVAHRGFEAEFLPLWQHCREKHQYQVLEFSLRVQRKKISQHLRDRLIASRSVRFSQTHALLGQVLGQVDALAARAVYDEDH